MLTPPDPKQFAKKVAGAAHDQLDQFEGVDEQVPKMTKQIKKYWETSLGAGSFPGVGEAWSAVFISFCVKTAGATAQEFKFSARHSEFVNEAINHPGAFEGVKITDEAVNIGDIIHNNRDNHTFDFQHAKTHTQYNSHSAIVIERGVDSQGKFARTVGGNEGNAVRKKKVRLNNDGTIKQRSANPYICLLKNRK